MPSGVADGALIIDTGLNNKGVIRDAAQFRRCVQTLTQAVRTSGQQMARGMDGYLRALQRAGAASKGATADQKALTAEIAKTEAAIKRLEERQELQRRKFEAAKEDAIGKAQEEFQANNAGADAMPWENEEQALEALSEELNRVVQEASDAFGSFEDSAAFRNTSVEIEYLQERLAALQEQLAETREQQPQGDGGAAEQARQAGDDAANAGEKAKTAAEKALEAWKKMPTVSGQIRAGFQSIAQSVATVRLAFNNPLQALDRLVGTVISKGIPAFIKFAGSAAKAAASVAKVAGSAALGYLRRLAEGAKNAAIQLAKLSGRAIGSGFKTLGAGIWNGAKAMLGFNRASNQGSNSLKQGLMAVLKYGLGIRGLFALFRRLRTAISDGLGEIAKQNPRVNAQLNSFKAALNGLKGSLASAFAPIFTAVAPALIYLINLLTAAINTIAAFMAALTGQGTYQKAVAGISGAGGAASNAGSAADDAAESYKELKRELAGFDDLDVLGSKDTDSSSGSGGGGGGGGGGSGGFSYETEEIGSGIVDFVAKLKEMWANADYEGIGRIIADGINGAFAKAKDWISWDNLGDKITEVVNGITGIINGLVDGVNWELIGQTFGEGINTLVKTINLLLTGINWENIGKGFADGLGGLVDTVHWDELGQLFANRLNALIGTIKGFVSNFRWGDAGTSFAKTLNGLFDTVKWSDLSDAATKAINGILATMKTLVSGFRWDNAATNITNAINRLFDGVDWDALGEVASGAINKILATMKTIVSGFRWENAATNLTNAINRLFDGVEWDTLSETATTALNRLIATIKTTVSGFRWANAGETFGNTLNSLFSGTNWTELGKTAAAAIAGPLEAIKNAVTTFSFGDAGTDFAKIINGFFSNTQLWSDAGTIVSEAIKGLFKFGENFFLELDTEQIANRIKEAVSKIDWHGIAEAMWKFLKAAIAGLGKGLADLLSPIQEEADDYEIVIGATGEVYFVPKPGEGLHTEGDHWELDENVEGEVNTTPEVDKKTWFDKLQGANIEAEVNTTPEADKQTWFDKLKSAGLEAEVDTTPKVDKKTWSDKLKGEDLEAPVDTKVTLVKNGWTSISAFVGTAVTVLTSLGKNGWSSIAGFVGTAVNVATSLTKNGWSSIGSYVGTAVSVATSLTKNGWTTIAAFVGTAVSVVATLSAKNKTKNVFDTALDIIGKMIAKNKTTSVFDTHVDVTGKLTDKSKKQLTSAATKAMKGIKVTVKASGSGGNAKLQTQATGGVIAGGLFRRFGAGGVISGGLARYLAGVPHYAGGTTRAHGTVFVAGEAGPEVMGHINGRTEVLNKSQLAQTMYSAVLSAMGQAVSALGTFLSGQLANCTNAIVATIGNLSGVANIQYHGPVMASGTVLPYDVAARIERAGMDIRNTLDANNEDLIQTIISVAGQIVAAVQNSGNREQGTGNRNGGGLTARQVIDDINRRAQMFGSSPVLN